MNDAAAMNDVSNIALWGAFVLGISGGFGHCLAMCGPFVAAASIADGSARKEGVRRVPVFQLGYHAGRIATYAVLGALLGLLGGAGELSTLAKPFSPEAITRWVKLSAGVGMAVLGVLLLFSWAVGRSVRIPEPTKFLASATWFNRVAAWMRRSGGWWGLPLGLLMGLLPCMPLLPAELIALSTQSAAGGAATMLAFGLGTVPPLIGVGLASGLVAERARGWMVPVSGVVMSALGGYTVWQGLQLLAMR